jgi:hypothetical protein
VKYAFGLLLALLVFSLGHAAPMVSLTAVPVSTVAPSNVVMTWTASEVGSCLASGGWSGTKASLGGTETIVNVLGSTSYTLTCSSTTGTVTVMWTAPTQNVDGSPLTNLAGFKLYRSTTYANVATSIPIVIADPLATQYLVSGLVAGNHYFGMSAYNTPGIESAITGTITKAVTTSTLVASASVTLEQRPKPPLVVVNVMAYEIKTLRGVYAFARYVGDVPLETGCAPDTLIAPNYHQVPKQAVALLPGLKLKTNAVLVAACEVMA